MAFQDKLDYVGLTKPENEGTTQNPNWVPTLTSLGLKANAQNRSQSTLQIVKSTGEIQCDELYGDIYAPTCEYTINSNTNLDIYQLGKVYGVPINGKKFGLQQISVSTSAGGEPTVSSTSVQLESGADRTVTIYEIPHITISPLRHAQTFGIGEIENEQCCMTLQSTNLTISATIDPSTINGDPVASDATQGVATFEVTIWSRSETKTPEEGLEAIDDPTNTVKWTLADEPGITDNLKWHITSPWTCVGSDSSMFVWTATYTKYLRKYNVNPTHYTVTLNGVGGTGTNLTKYTYGESEQLPTDWTKSGMYFDGWYKDSSYNDGPFTYIPAGTIGNLQYWAKWSVPPETNG